MHGIVHPCIQISRQHTAMSFFQFNTFNFSDNHDCNLRVFHYILVASTEKIIDKIKYGDDVAKLDILSTTSEFEDEIKSSQSQSQMTILINGNHNHNYTQLQTSLSTKKNALQCHRENGKNGKTDQTIASWNVLQMRIFMIVILLLLTIMVLIL